MYGEPPNGGCPVHWDAITGKGQLVSQSNICLFPQRRARYRFTKAH